MQLELIVTEVFDHVTQEQKDQLQQSIDKIVGLGDRIRDMVSLRTLDIQDMQFSEQSLKEIVQSAVNKHQSRAVKAGLKMALSLPETIPLVHLNPPHPINVVHNHLDNA